MSTNLKVLTVERSGSLVPLSLLGGDDDEDDNGGFDVLRNM